jgi:hypothetical protein
MPQGTRTILLLLEARNTKLSRLLYQAPPSQSPQIFPKPDSDITVQPRVHKIIIPKSNKYKGLCQRVGSGSKTAAAKRRRQRSGNRAVLEVAEQQHK